MHVFGRHFVQVVRAQARPDPPPPYRPAAGAKDLRAVLFNWTWHMGMLRGVDEHELVASLEYQGKGTIQVDGEPCTLMKYRVSTNYQIPGQRVQYTCTEITCTMPAAISMRNSGMCSTCHTENNFS